MPVAGRRGTGVELTTGRMSGDRRVQSKESGRESRRVEGT